jgi:hypothetical protein
LQGWKPLPVIFEETLLSRPNDDLLSIAIVAALLRLIVVGTVKRDVMSPNGDRDIGVAVGKQVVVAPVRAFLFRLADDTFRAKAVGVLHLRAADGAGMISEIKTKGVPLMTVSNSEVRLHRPSP